MLGYSIRIGVGAGSYYLTFLAYGSSLGMSLSMYLSVTTLTSMMPSSTIIIEVWKRDIKLSVRSLGLITSVG